MMTVFVTGGTGMVGSRLLQHLVKAGWECRALVRPGKDAPTGVTRVEGDLFDAAALRQGLEGVSAVIHLAAVFRTTDEAAIWRVNLEGTRALLAATQEHAPQARFVMASTGLVYAEDAGRPGLEADEVHPKGAYPASKVAAEKELRECGLTWSVLRLPFVYGDGDEHLAAVPRIVSMMKWHPAQTFSLGHQRDVSRAFELALTGAMDGRIVNITDDAPASLYDMAMAIGVRLEPSAEPLKNPWQGRSDGSLSRTLGFRPTIATLSQAKEQGIL
jgi:nucleoside-diphosphate-sugar epimerase